MQFDFSGQIGSINPIDLSDYGKQVHQEKYGC